MTEQEFLDKALHAIKNWRSGEIEHPEFSLVHENNKGFVYPEIEVISPLIVGKLMGIGQAGKPIYKFNALSVKEALVRPEPPTTAN